MKIIALDERHKCDSGAEMKRVSWGAVNAAVWAIVASFGIVSHDPWWIPFLAAGLSFNGVVQASLEKRK